MMVESLYDCLGLSFLGQCTYNPSHPATNYFTIGNAVSALGLALAIQQLIKPIYIFRLQSYGLRLSHITIGIFAGFLCTIVAALLPNIPSSHQYFFQYPLNWEILGGLIIACAYGVVAIVVLRPAKIHKFNFISFTKAASHFLSEADDIERARFVDDLQANILPLIEYSNTWKKAEFHDSSIEFERLKSIGAPLQIQGRAPPSAFYRFSHREELKRGSYANLLLSIISDPQFCIVLVKDCPWKTASLINKISEHKAHSDLATGFIQELALQALVNDESLITRELDYDGFGTYPILSESLFRDYFILHSYRPYDKFRFEYFNTLTDGVLKRFTASAKMTLAVALKGGEFWQPQYLFGIGSAFEGVYRQVSFIRHKDIKSEISFYAHHGIHDYYEMVSETLSKLAAESRKSLFRTQENKFRHDLVHIVAKIIYDSLENISNNFQGTDDKLWVHAISTFTEIFPSSKDEPEGLNPLQQHLAVMIQEKLQRNMEGWYPSLSRLLLSVIGPYERHSDIKKPTAYVILKDIVYLELRKLKSLHSKKAKAIADFLPPNVSYNSFSNSLTHRSKNKDTKKVTKLSDLAIPHRDLFNPDFRQV